MQERVVGRLKTISAGLDSKIEGLVHQWLQASSDVDLVDNRTGMEISPLEDDGVNLMQEMTLFVVLMVIFMVLVDSIAAAITLFTITRIVIAFISHYSSHCSDTFR
eukprot:TRINITY_DN1704_c0_g1_i1.p1 TRINITY_DN1704_c0_g1~~TRINITY_DN1704_c0_g1_i1.p1  ORF type:complete len:106 (+),score=7.41 TRINITY_DN1704_c0_g1_i1:59-376(+)